MNKSESRAERVYANVVFHFNFIFHRMSLPEQGTKFLFKFIF